MGSRNVHGEKIMGQLYSPTEAVGIFLAIAHLRRRDFARASAYVNSSLHWISTPHGSDYWQRIYSGISVLSHIPRSKTTTKEDIDYCTKKMMVVFHGLPLEIEQAHLNSEGSKVQEVYYQRT